MKKAYRALHGFLILLPAFVLIACWFYAVCIGVPKQVRSDAKLATNDLRDQIEDFQHHPETATFIGRRPRGQGWKTAGYVNGLAWGRQDEANTLTLWWEDQEGLCHAKSMPLPEPPSYFMEEVLSGLFILAFTILLVWIACTYQLFIRQRDDFLAAQAHDLTTPLMGLKMLIGKDDAASKLIVEQMLKMVENIRSFLQLHGRHRLVQVRSLDLRKVAEKACLLFREEYEDHFPGEDIAILGVATASADSILTGQIVWNLLSNALKYAVPLDGRVVVELEETADKAILRVRDTGPGLKKTERRRVFKRYYRALSARNSGQNGFGIGLPAAKSLAKLEKGSLTLTANSPTGCVFALTLPRGEKEAENE